MAGQSEKRWRWGSSVLAMMLALGAGGVASAQDAQPAPAEAEAEDEEIVVVGFRGSLRQSLEVKRDSDGFVDAITAEDIADFPDLNLAESVQRIPGVAIDRDSGEGRSIVVRGLGAEFTRVRVNGLEALTTTGGKDGSGGNNRGRQFDFNIFASELFNSITVRKSSSAAVEEGSLGATVDLRAARPFDYEDFTMGLGAQAGYNDLAQTYDPRATFLISNRWDTGIGEFGALFSVAYTHRNVWEEGSSTGRWENPSFGTQITGTASGLAFPCSGAAYNPTSGPPLTCGQIGQGPGNTVPTSTNPAPAGTVNNSWHPRIPRYGRLTYDQDRLGITTALQWQNDSTEVSFDWLHAEFTGSRQEHYLEVIGFSRSGQGVPQMDVVDYDIDAQGRLLAGTFDDADVRVEERFDELNTYFNEYTLAVEHEFSDRFRLNFLAGQALSHHTNPIQTTASFERYDTDGYSYDYSDDDALPFFDYGFDVTDPNQYAFCSSIAPFPANCNLPGGVVGLHGDASLIRMRPSVTDNTVETAALDLEFDLNESFTLLFGASNKTFDFFTSEVRRTGNTEVAPALSAGDCNGDGIRGDCTMADISHLVTDFGRAFDLPAGTDTSWVVPDLNAIAAAFNIYCNCIDEGPDGVYNSTAGPDLILGNADDVRAGDDVDYRMNVNGLLGGNRDVEESTDAGYVAIRWDTVFAGMPVRGDFGVRYFETEVTSSGYLGTNFITSHNSYTDTLPSLNVVVEPVDDFLVRFAASEAISRPDLPRLTPGGSITPSAGGVSMSIGNPLLEPIRSTNYDLAFEWYFAEEALISVSFFHKELESYQQLVRSDTTFDQVAADYNLPSTILDGSALDGDPFNTIPTIFVHMENTPGGDLDGYEISYQQPFTFLPGILANFGTILNYTHVESDIVYFLNLPAPPAEPTTVTLPLLNLSPETWNATLYYEDDRFSARVSAAHRDRYVTGPFAAINGNDSRGKRETLNVDTAASFALNDHITFTFEGINLTDQADDRWLNSTLDFTESFERTGRQYYVGFRYTY
jgi:iron complex outermembrane recepter protein